MRTDTNDKEKDKDQREETADQASLDNNNSGKENESNQHQDEQLQSDDAEEKLLRKEYDEIYDKYIRLYSDFENFRRRTAKEKLEIIEQANSNLITNLLPVIDDLERALNSAVNDDSSDVFRKGVELIYSKFKKELEHKGLEPIDAIGSEFDPELHDAITKVAAPDAKMKGKVVDQIEKGYKLNDKIIRFAKVVVGE